MRTTSREESTRSRLLLHDRSETPLRAELEVAGMPPAAFARDLRNSMSSGDSLTPQWQPRRLGAAVDLGFSQLTLPGQPAAIDRQHDPVDVI